MEEESFFLKNIKLGGVKIKITDNENIMILKLYKSFKKFDKDYPKNVNALINQAESLIENHNEENKKILFNVIQELKYCRNILQIIYNKLDNYLKRKHPLTYKFKKYRSVLINFIESQVIKIEKIMQDYENL